MGRRKEGRKVEGRNERKKEGMIWMEGRKERRMKRWKERRNERKKDGWMEGRVIGRK